MNFVTKAFLALIFVANLSTQGYAACSLDTPGKCFDTLIDNTLPTYKFFVRVVCVQDIQLKVEYIPLGSSSWTTSYYNLEGGERAFLFSTTNKFVGISAVSRVWETNPQKWERTQVNMGDVINGFEYRLTCI